VSSDSLCCLDSSSSLTLDVHRLHYHSRYWKCWCKVSACQWFSWCQSTTYIDRLTWAVSVYSVSPVMSVCLCVCLCQYCARGAGAGKCPQTNDACHQWTVGLYIQHSRRRKPTQVTDTCRHTHRHTQHTLLTVCVCVSRFIHTRLWNNLPVELRQRDILVSVFRRLLKTFLFCWDLAPCDVLFKCAVYEYTYLLTYIKHTRTHAHTHLHGDICNLSFLWNSLEGRGEAQRPSV